MLLIHDHQPQVRNGRNKAERAPTTSPASPSAAIFHKRRRSVIVTPECHSAGFAPNRASTRVRNSAVSAISGNSTSACRPARRHSATASR